MRAINSDSESTQIAWVFCSWSSWVLLCLPERFSLPIFIDLTYQTHVQRFHFVWNLTTSSSSEYKILRNSSFLFPAKCWHWRFFGQKVLWSMLRLLTVLWDIFQLIINIEFRDLLMTLEPPTGGPFSKMQTRSIFVASSPRSTCISDILPLARKKKLFWEL